MAGSLRFYGDEVSFWVVSGQSSCLPLVWFRVLPGGAHISQPRWIPTWGVLGGWRDISSSPSSFWPLLISWIDFKEALHSLSGPPVVVHSSRYHHAWPRQVVSVMGSPTSTSFRHHFFCLKTALPHCVLWNKRPLKHSGGNLWVISLGERLYTISWSRWFLMHIENSEESNSL